MHVSLGYQTSAALCAATRCVSKLCAACYAAGAGRQQANLQNVNFV
jgi:hypothetical protein